MITDILIAIAEKILPEVIKKFIPLVKVQPKKLKFIRNKWTSNFSFFLYNRSKEVLFGIYLLIDIEDAKIDDFKLSKNKHPKDLNISIGDIEVNYEVLQLNCIHENEKEFILLKIEQINPESFISFKIEANTNSNVKFKIIKYSKNQIATLHKSQSGAISFEIPLKEKVKLKGMSLMMKKNN